MPQCGVGVLKPPMFTLPAGRLLLLLAGARYIMHCGMRTAAANQT